MDTVKRSGEKARRDQAEQFLIQHPDVRNRNTCEDLRSLNHELQVHQIELEMQNDELQASQAELEKLKERYVDLYEFAPVSYFIFNRTGLIEEANLTGTRLLGNPRSRILHRPFTIFLAKDSTALFLRHMMEVFSSSAKQTCELIMRIEGAESMRYVSLESIAIGAGEQARMRSVAIDITTQKLGEAELVRTRQELADANEELRRASNRLLEVQEEERRRIAYEVHDCISSSLGAMRIRLLNTLAASGMEKDGEELLSQLQVIIDEARRIQRALRPSILDDLGLVVAVNSLCREFRQNNPHFSMDTEFGLEERIIHEPIKIQIFRIAQEALNNIVKHANANIARVSLTKGQSSIDLVIGDNGRGFDVNEALSRDHTLRGLGLSSMKERAILSGGAFSIESAKGKGTTLRVSWPLT